MRKNEPPHVLEIFVKLTTRALLENVPVLQVQVVTAIT